MALALTIIGLLLVALAVNDIFLTLFHPAGRGAMRDWTARLIWKSLLPLSPVNVGSSSPLPARPRC